MATAVDLAGVPYPRTFAGHAIEPAEGRSLRPLLQGAARTPARALFWEHEGNRAVREGKWKLVARHKGDWELYDVEADRTELTDLAAKNPAQVKAMAAKYEAWATRVGAKPWPQ
jgi:arylsulfatase